MRLLVNNVIKVIAMSHLTVIHADPGLPTLVWDWDQLARDVSSAIKTYEYSKMSKDELEEQGRKLGIELDRRKKLPKLVEQLVQFEMLNKFNK